jgi:hypothetical protein
MTASSERSHRVGWGRRIDRRGGIRRLFRKCAIRRSAIPKAFGLEAATRIFWLSLGGPKVREGLLEVSAVPFSAWLLGVLLIAAGAGIAAQASDRADTPCSPVVAPVEQPIVLTQLPAAELSESKHPLAGGTLRTPYGEGARLMVLSPDGATKLLSEGFHSAADPDVSFDGTRLLFAGKRAAGDRWNIFEMNVDGSGVHQVTQAAGDCRNPSYQSTLYTIVSAKPWYQLTFVASIPETMNECGLGLATSLYSCKLDGTALRRLTFNLSGDMDPYLMPDGRLVFAGWQRARLNHGPWGRIGLFGVNIDGADYAAFCTEEGKRIKQMPCVTTKGLVVFVETDDAAWHGGGSLGSVTTRRPLHSYRPVTRVEQGVFHSPSPLPDGRVLVSRLSTDGRGTYGLGVLDPQTGRFESLFDDPEWHDIQAKVIGMRAEPDGRSSVVTEEDPNGKLYCLSVYTNDLKESDLPRGSVKRLRVLEGIPLQAGGAGSHGIPAVSQRRILGEVPVAADGSFNIEVPANTPIELQILDDKGMALRRCGWIWAKNHEPRGCIGCHEDGELTPENIMVEALTRPSVKLTLPSERRRTVDLRRDVMPILAAKCADCHTEWDSPVRLTRDLSPVSGEGRSGRFNLSYESLLQGAKNGKGRYIHAGGARTSPLIWSLYGRNTSRPWDGSAGAGEVIEKMPPDGSEALTDEEKQTFVEWVDLGALWDGLPEPAHPPAPKNGGGQ